MGRETFLLCTWGEDELLPQQACTSAVQQEEEGVVQPGDFHRNVEELREEVIPQHNYRLDAKSLNSRHYGEVSCRNFRESVLAAMPHR